MKNRFKSILLLVVGVMFGILPVFAANIFMRDYVYSHGETQMELATKRMLVRAETVIQEAIDVFSALPHYRVPACDEEMRHRFRDYTLRRTVLHDVGLVQDGTHFYCSSIDEEMQFLATANPVKGAVPHLSYVPVIDARSEKRGLLITWAINERVALGGFVHDDRLMVDVMPVDYSDVFTTALKTSAGANVVLSSPSVRLMEKAPFAVVQYDPAWNRDLVKAELVSQRYPIRIEAAVPFAAVWDSFSGAMNFINGLSMLMGGMIFIGFLRVSLQKPKPYVSIEEGISNREFVPYYQPVIDIQSGRLAGCEVLVRWRKPDGTIVPPGHFIGLAEASGLAMPMTSLLMEQVAEDLSEAYRLNSGLKAGINLFNRHFDNLMIVGEIEQIFGNSGIRFEQLVFEITERQPLENLDRARAIISRMQKLGVKVALDDAGTGHGGFAYLQKLGMDIIKIDKLFVDAIGPDSEHVPIVDSLSQMAKGMDMTIVAEGVETEEQLSYLRRSGVDQAQGYLFAPALPAKAFLDLVSAMNPESAADRRQAGPVSAEQVTETVSTYVRLEKAG